MSTSALGKRALLGLLLLQGVAGLIWSVQQLGELPHYGDSLEYLEAARSLRIDAHRGIAYPLFLAGVDRATPGPSWLRWVRPDHAVGACPMPPGMVAVQLLQFLLVGAALLFFFRTLIDFAPEPLRARSRAVAYGLTGLVLFDPLIAHFSLSIMVDALALAASLVFCAALLRLVLGGPRRVGASAALLFLAFVFSVMLRPEKGYVLLGVVAASTLLWGALLRWAPAPFASAIGAESGARHILARGGLALGLVALGLGVVDIGQRPFHDEIRHSDPTSALVHGRLVFPHLAAIHPALSEPTRKLFTPADVTEYDAYVMNPGGVMARVTRGDPALARQVTRELAATALRERWGELLFDITKDALENALPTAGWYTRLIAMAEVGLRNYRERFSLSDASVFTFIVMARHHPKTTRVVLGLSGASFGVCLGLALWQAARAGRRRRPIVPLAAFGPCALFALGNGALFALHADLMHPRYTIAAAAMGLGLIYGAALAWAWRPRPDPLSRIPLLGLGGSWGADTQAPFWTSASRTSNSAWPRSIERVQRPTGRTQGSTGD